MDALPPASRTPYLWSSGADPAAAPPQQLLDIVHPAARILVDIARSQDAEVGDGTTSVVVLAGEILKEIKEHVENGVSSQIIIKGLRRACSVAVNKLKEIAISTDEASHRETLAKLAATAMTSKLIKRNTEFFTKSTFRLWCPAHILRDSLDTRVLTLSTI